MKYYLIKTNEEIPHADMPYVELTVEDLKAIGYSITNTCEAFGDKLPNVVSKIRKVLE